MSRITKITMYIITKLTMHFRFEEGREEGIEFVVLNVIRAENIDF